MNSVTLIGRLGADPETRTFDSGNSVTEMRLATDDGYKKDGEKIDRTNWHRVKAWGKLGEVLGKYLSKGDQVAIQGRIEYSEHESDGQKRYYTDIVATGFDFVGGRNSDQPQRDPNKYDEAPGSSPGDDDIPF